MSQSLMSSSSGRTSRQGEGSDRDSEKVSSALNLTIPWVKEFPLHARGWTLRLPDANALPSLH